MKRDRFEAWQRAGVAKGQHQLADTLRLLVYKADPDLFDQLDFDSARCFLDPLLFAYFTDPAPTLPLPQLLYGLIPAERRPPSVELRTDANGRAYLPGIGELETTVVDRSIELRRDPASSDPTCHMDGQDLPTRWRTPLIVPGTGIEVLRDRHPLLDRFFTDAEGAPVEFEMASATADHYQHLVAAFTLLHEHCPELWEEIAATTRRIGLYRGRLPNSFATLSAHGAVFFNTTDAIDEVFFLDDIAHQCGHVLFNALTLNKEHFLTIDPMTPLRSLNGAPQERRSLYSAFHGLFTYTSISLVLSTFLVRQVFDGRQAHEVLGRLGFTMGKFRSDLALLDQPVLFTRLGHRCYRRFAAAHRELHARYATLLGLLDYANQPYVFSYPRFAEANPCPSPSWPTRAIRASRQHDHALAP
jgi:HEXXH motif-containing protein